MENKLNLDEIEKLPAKERALLKKRHALHCKYEKAVTLYADTTLSAYSGGYPFSISGDIRSVPS